MNATITDIQFLIEAIQQKADGLIRQLQEETKEEILRDIAEQVDKKFDEAYAEHIKAPPNTRSKRTAARKQVRRTRK